MRSDALCLASLLLAIAMGANGQPQTIVGGLDNDYQISVQVPQAAPATRFAVFERLNASFVGDLWATHSLDAGATWSTPQAVVAGPANERHPSLVEASEGGWLLFHLSNASGAFRIHRATSGDGFAFSASVAIDLGWPSGGEINPQVTRLQDGRLLLVYHRLSGAAYAAVSSDDGASWDTARTAISPGAAALPRVAQRPGDGRLLLVYQTNPGTHQLQLWARGSLDPLAWTDVPQSIAGTGNNHDAWPQWTPSNGWQVFWARAEGGSFQIHRSRSPDGLAWSPPEPLSDRPGLANVQPTVLSTAIGTELYWGAAQVSGDANYDLVREVLETPVEAVFSDGFESAAAH